MENTFKEILDHMLDTYERKNHDYGNSFAELYGKYGDVYPLIHIEEKLNRVRQLLHSEAEVDESINDSILDLANYAVMYLAERVADEKVY